MSSEKTMPRGFGWHMPPGSKKFHYFEDTRSLCGKYGFMVVEGEPDSGTYTDQDCQACVRELRRREKRDQSIDRPEGPT